MTRYLGLLLVLLTMVGCAAAPTTSTERRGLTDDELLFVESTNKAMAVADAKTADEYREALCAMPPGPQREEERKKALTQYGWRIYCPDAPKSAGPPPTSESQ